MDDQSSDDEPAIEEENDLAFLASVVLLHDITLSLTDTRKVNAALRLERKGLLSIERLDETCMLVTAIIPVDDTAAPAVAEEQLTSTSNQRTARLLDFFDEADDIEADFIAQVVWDGLRVELSDSVLIALAAKFEARGLVEVNRYPRDHIFVTEAYSASDNQINWKMFAVRVPVPAHVRKQIRIGDDSAHAYGILLEHEPRNWLDQAAELRARDVERGRGSKSWAYEVGPLLRVQFFEEAPTGIVSHAPLFMEYLINGDWLSLAQVMALP